MTSHPIIGAELSDIEREFIDWVEARVGIERHDDHTVKVSASRVDTDEDFSIHRHAVEFRGAGRNGRAAPVAYIRHTMKRIESGQGRYTLVESRFEVAGVGVPRGRARYEDVERIVQAWLDRTTQCCAISVHYTAS